jgi:hypothetical protein
MSQRTIEMIILNIHNNIETSCKHMDWYEQDFL